MVLPLLKMHFWKKYSSKYIFGIIKCIDFFIFPLNIINRELTGERFAWMTLTLTRISFTFTKMFSIHKNSYLQSQYPEINPRLLNRCVQRGKQQQLTINFSHIWLRYNIITLSIKETVESYWKFINKYLKPLLNVARDYEWIDVHDLEPPLHRLVSEHPNIPVPNVDVTRRPLAFGRRAMPKLVRTLRFFKYVLKSILLQERRLFNTYSL